MKTNNLVLLICSLVILNGCVRYHRVNDIKKNYNKVINQSNTVILRIANDYKIKKEAYDSITMNISSISMLPYPALKQNLLKMNQSIDKQRKHHSRMKIINNSLTKKINKKNKIKSNQPEWDILQKSNNNLKQEYEELRDEVNRYQKFSEKYGLIAKKYKIVKIDTIIINKNLKNYDLKLGQAVKKAREEIKKANLKLSLMKNNEISENEKSQKKIILKDMQSVLNNISKMRTVIDQQVKKFNRESRGRKQYWTGPGMISHEILTEIQNSGIKLNNESQKLKKLARDFSN